MYVVYLIITCTVQHSLIMDMDSIDGKHLKSTLESNHDVAGYRNARQVLSNSLPALFAATLWTILFAQPSYSFLAQYSDAVREVMGLGTFRGMASIADGTWKGDGAWCVLDRTVDKGWSRALVYAALGCISSSLPLFSYMELTTH